MPAAKQEFLEKVVAGQYIKVQGWDRPARVEKVFKTTRTQIVLRSVGYDSKYHDTRFKIATGDSIGDSWAFRKRILDDEVTEQERAAYDAQELAEQKFRDTRERINQIEASVKKCVIRKLRGSVPETKIKVAAISNDGLVTVRYKIEIADLTEEELTAAFGSGLDQQ